MNTLQLKGLESGHLEEHRWHVDALQLIARNQRLHVRVQFSCKETRIQCYSTKLGEREQLGRQLVDVVPVEYQLLQLFAAYYFGGQSGQVAILRV